MQGRARAAGSAAPGSPAAVTGVRLRRRPATDLVPPVLDTDQQAVVDHPGGPLLVLAGPGTGKTTTLLEAVAERVRRGTAPERILVLTFSRKAADELRARIAARVARTTSEPSAWTFHSWCLAVLTRESPPGETLRLLSGAERLVRLRELLRGNAEAVGTVWPAALVPALGTRGLAVELADLLDRARERGLTPDDVGAQGERDQRQEWLAGADFFGEYLDVLAVKGEIDYGELVRRTLELLRDETVLDAVRARYDAVFVDEFQDTDPAQRQLLTLLAGDGRDLVVVGDPDQSIYAFRGADVSGILEFADRFPQADGRPAPVLTLRTSRRAGEALLDVSRRLARRIPAPGLNPKKLVAHRDLRAAGPAAEHPGDVRVLLHSTAADEALAIADLLRRAHLEDDVPWSEMAVLVRSGKRSIPVLRRALVAAAVPVSVASDELPVARDPAVAPLLLALRCAAQPSALDAEAVRTLLQSPLIGASPSLLRGLGRALRTVDAAGRPADESDDAERPVAPGRPRPSAELLRDAVLDPRELTLVDPRLAGPAQRLHALLEKARAALGDGLGAQEALWALWAGTRWPARLQAASAAGGQPGRAADRDLDGIVALFDAVARLEERQPRVEVAGLLAELEAQEIPGQRREGAAREQGVRLLTAHRSKGLEWRLVVVAGVQEGVWPDLRRRGSLLEADRLGRPVPDDAAELSGLLVDERRLLYVAITRAKETLVVTAVQGEEEAGERASRFLDELGVEPEQCGPGLGGRLTPGGLVARLRRALDDDASPEPLRHEAAQVLAQLASARGADGSALVPAADPDRWWGVLPWTEGAHAVRDPELPIALSGTAINAYRTCPLSWFLEREAAASGPTSAAMGFGSVVHVLARLVTEGTLPAELDAMAARIEQVWHELRFAAPWHAEAERARAIEACERFLVWHRANERVAQASERDFSVAVGDATLRGSFDRVDVDADGGVHVVDFKTQKNARTKDQVESDAQLGVYQLAVREGAVAEIGTTPAGAELVQLRLPEGKGSAAPKVQRQAPPADDWVDQLVTEVAAGIRAEAFPARVNERCDKCPYRRTCPAHESGLGVVR